MITPVEIQNKVFKSGGLGYDKKDVDAFIREVQKSYENVYRENGELKDKVAALNEGIQYYKSMEKTMQKALILAEKTASDTKEAANRNAKHIEQEAAAKANIMLADAKNELEKLHAQTVALIQQYEKYKVQFKNLAKAQIELLESDAFSINVQRLDAFISENNFVQGTKEYVNRKSDKKDDKALDSKENEVREIISENKKVNDESDEESYDEFDFSDLEIEGQEVLDLLDYEDSGSKA